MDGAVEHALRDQLLDRRQRLNQAMERAGSAQDLVRLLQQVDSALSRMDSGGYGVCEICAESIEEKDLLANPLIRYCLCSLSPEQQRALENDLDLAWRIQAALLPRQDVKAAGWEAHYRYEPAGPVSGDTCDLIPRPAGDGGLFFAIGDVSGKGVAASLLMAHLNASFRSLIDVGVPIEQFVERANRLLMERTVSLHYATLACGRASDSGDIEFCNAGHCAPVLVHEDKAELLEATGLPVGMMGEQSYAVEHRSLEAGDVLFLYTDGITEARNRDDQEYGLERLAGALREKHSLPPRALAGACLADLAVFLGGAPRTDDLSLMILRRTE